MRHIHRSLLMSLRTASRFVAALGVSLLCVEGASAHYVGESFLYVPEYHKGERNQVYSKWLRIEAHYWKGEDKGSMGAGGIAGFRRNFRALYYSGPMGHARAQVKSRSRSTSAIHCCQGSWRVAQRRPIFAEMTFVESAARSRGLSELGWQRPEQIPEFFEYGLRESTVHRLSGRGRCARASVRHQLWQCRATQLQSGRRWTRAETRAGGSEADSIVRHD